MGCLTYGSLFTGIGGFDLGFDRAGMRGLWQIEIDKDCNRVLEKHWHETKRFRDITKIDIGALPKPDVICGGFPCQDLSVAGQRKGLAGKRSGLWREFHRIIKGVAPRFVVIENVPGLFSSNEGRDFLTIIRGMAQLGYCLAWTVLDSQYRGVAQRRGRVFLVGSLGNGSCAEILFEPESVCGHSPPSRETGKRIAGTISSRTEGGGGLGTDFEIDGGLIPEVAFNDANGTRKDRPDGGLYVTKPKAAPALTGAESPVRVVSHALRSEGADASEDGTGRGTPLIVMPALRAGCPNGTAGHGARSGDSKDDYIVSVASPITAGYAKGSGVNDGKKGSPQNLVFAERTRKNGANVETQSDLSYALTNPASGRRSPSRNLMQGASVRRLTPRECERLQGFPDDWTRWDATGKEISDSARYRMLGNAVTVPVAGWIGSQLFRFA